MSQEWKERWKQAPAKVSQAAKAVVAAMPKRVVDPFHSDLARQREINERGKPSRWLPRRKDWLTRA